MGPKRLNGAHADAEGVAETTARNVRPGGVYRGSTSPEDIGGASTEIGERERSRSRFGEDVEIERCGCVEGSRWKLSDEILSADPRQMRADASDQ